jgi:hypothetical protein
LPFEPHGLLVMTSCATTTVPLGPASVGLFTDGIAHANYATIEVVNGSEAEANECWAWADLVKPRVSLPLHYAGTDGGAAEGGAPRIRVNRKKPARLDLAFALPPPDRPPSGIVSEVTVISGVPMFIYRQEAPMWKGRGCWLAQPLAMENPDLRLEAYLPPGEYRVTVTVGCENGTEESREYMLVSPESWQDLGIRLV